MLAQVSPRLVAAAAPGGGAAAFLWRGGAKRNLLVALSGVGLLAAVSTSAIGDGLVASEATAPADLASVLDARSPGERTVAELQKVKDARSQMLLAQARQKQPWSEAADEAIAGPPAGAAPYSGLGGPEDVASVQDDLFGPAPLDFGAPLASAAFAGPPVPTGGGILPPDGGGLLAPGTGGTPPPGTGAPPPDTGGSVTPPPAVPEPGTWMTMLIGFWAVGLSLRRKERLRRASRGPVAPR